MLKTNVKSDKIKLEADLDARRPTAKAAAITLFVSLVAIVPLVLFFALLSPAFVAALAISSVVLRVEVVALCLGAALSSTALVGTIAYVVDRCLLGGLSTKYDLDGTDPVQAHEMNVKKHFEEGMEKIKTCVDILDNLASKDDKLGFEGDSKVAQLASSSAQNAGVTR